MHKNIIIRYFLLGAGVTMLLLFGYYFATTIMNNLWEDTVFRLIQVVLFIGAGVFLGLVKIISNQEKLIQLLRERNGSDGA